MFVVDEKLRRKILIIFEKLIKARDLKYLHTFDDIVRYAEIISYLILLNY